MSISQHACLHVATEHLNAITVTATTQKELAIGRDVELARVGARWLIAYAGEHACPTVNGENGYSISLQAVARIKELAIGTQVDVCSTTCPYTVGNNLLKSFQLSFMVFEYACFPSLLNTKCLGPESALTCAATPLPTTPFSVRR